MVYLPYLFLVSPFPSRGCTEGQVMVTVVVVVIVSRDPLGRTVSQCCSVTFADWFLSSPVPIWGNSLFRSMYSVLFKCNSDLLSVLKYARRRPANIACIVTALYCTNCPITHTHGLIAGCDLGRDVRFV